MSGLLKVIIGTVIVTVIAAVVFFANRRKSKSKLVSALRSKGAQVQDDATLLPVSPSTLIVGAKKPPLWSARVDDKTGIFQLRAGHVVVCWKSQMSREDALLLYKAPGMGLGSGRKLEQIDFSNMPEHLRGLVVAYSGPSAADLIGTTNLGATFLTHSSAHENCSFILDGDGAYYLRYGDFPDEPDNLLDAARELEKSMFEKPAGA